MTQEGASVWWKVGPVTDCQGILCSQTQPPDVRPPPESVVIASLSRFSPSTSRSFSSSREAPPPTERSATRSP
ncbi:hypothetical protein AERO9AM_20701 [Aeromicrobium sp. 9AM]|nr:hypothetical protein AERO9AM_20701 [Aeromicrobium sp. 9AM]